MNVADLISLKHPIVSRVAFDDAGRPTLKCRSLDPAHEAFNCTCQRADCDMRQLISFREHIAQLFRALNVCDGANLLPGYEKDGESETWMAVTYHLHMAASLEDAFADTAYT